MTILTDDDFLPPSGEFLFLAEPRLFRQNWPDGRIASPGGWVITIGNHLTCGGFLIVRNEADIHAGLFHCTRCLDRHWTNGPWGSDPDHRDWFLMLMTEAGMQSD